jgi:hypothetical protein
LELFEDCTRRAHVQAVVAVEEVRAFATSRYQKQFFSAGVAIKKA